MFLLLLAAVTADPVSVLKELDRPEGTWRLVGVTEDEKTRKATMDTSLVIKADKFRMLQAGREAFAGGIDLNPERRVLVLLRADDREKLLLARYHLDGEVLTLTLGNGAVAPDDETEEAGSVATYKRAK